MERKTGMCFKKCSLFVLFLLFVLFVCLFVAVVCLFVCFVCILITEFRAKACNEMQKETAMHE